MTPTLVIMVPPVRTVSMDISVDVNLVTPAVDVRIEQALVLIVMVELV